MKNLIFILLVISMIASSCKEKFEKSLDLSGKWQFQIDPENHGVERKCFKPEKEYTGAAWYQKKFTVPSNWQ